MNLDQYITRTEIINALCRIRGHQAQLRHKKHLVHLLTNSKSFNYHLNTIHSPEMNDDDGELLGSIRRLWKKLGKPRYNEIEQNNINGKKYFQRLSAVDYNIKSIRFTIKYYEKLLPEEPFLQKLNLFIKEIQDSFDDPSYIIRSPNILPYVQDGTRCRPISMFSLKDRIIIGITNKYFTAQFDKYFAVDKNLKPCSYAFRASQKNEISGRSQSLTHHDAIQRILEYKKKFNGDSLWVAECDISKFFDVVDHSIVREQFEKLKDLLKKDSPEIIDAKAERIFDKYLKSYSFVKNVHLQYPESNESYWQSKKIPGGYFGWVEKELRESGYYTNILDNHIGIPQGGALSGLIANIVLNSADQDVLRSSDSDLLYLRYCDDIIIIHPEKDQCKAAAQAYVESVKKLHLFPHQFEGNLINSSDSFWHCKSKHPYTWSATRHNSIQKFGFLGYEISFAGDIRVRKKSLIKEKLKQVQVVTKISKAVKNGKRKNIEYIYESAVNRLIGMSVGRVTLKNFDRVNNEMCWVNGFSKLNDNRSLRAQLKYLDRGRNLQLARLEKLIKATPIKDIKPHRVKVKGSAFVIIPGVSDIHSKEIRSSLIANGILNSKLQISGAIDLNAAV